MVAVGAFVATVGCPTRSTGTTCRLHGQVTWIREDPVRTLDVTLLLAFGDSSRGARLHNPKVSTAGSVGDVSSVVAWASYTSESDVLAPSIARRSASSGTTGTWHLASAVSAGGMWIPRSVLVLAAILLAAVGVYLTVASRRRRAALSAAQRRAANKSWFLQQPAHSVRAPTAAVLGYLEVLRADRAVGEAGRELVDSAIREASHLSLLVDDLALAGTLEDGDFAVTFQPVPLRHEVERIVAGYVTTRPLATVDGYATAYTDPLRFRQVFRSIYLSVLHRARGLIAVTIATVDGLATVTLTVSREAAEPRLRESAPDVGDLSMSVAQRFALLLRGRLVESHDEGQSTVVLQLPAVEPG